MLYNSSESHRFNGEFSHSLTIWVTPATNASDLRLDFYGSEQDASSDLNRYCGSIITITASAADGVTVYLDQIPKSLPSVWVKMYFGGSTEERTVTLQVEMGVKATAQLLGREISILLEPWQGEG
jgi:hypothetical protein